MSAPYRHRYRSVSAADFRSPVICEHGVFEATYSLAADGTRLPTLICLCGEAFREDTWEQAGSYLDAHVWGCDAQ